MSLHWMGSVLALALLLASTASVRAERAEENKRSSEADKPKQTKPPDQADLERLIRRLGSDSFADREEAMKELRRLGKPALEALRDAAANSQDKEVRRRAAELVDRLLEPPYDKQFKEGVRLLEKKEYRKAAAALKQAAQRIVAVFSDGAIKVYDPSSGEVLNTILNSKQ